MRTKIPAEEIQAIRAAVQRMKEEANLCSKCRERPRVGKQRWCQVCKNAYNRANRPAYVDIPEIDKVKSSVRGQSRYRLRKGEITKKPCRCGSPDSQMHHPDYSKPELVEWLCFRCHRDLHRSEEHGNVKQPEPRSPYRKVEKAQNAET